MQAWSLAWKVADVDLQRCSARLIQIRRNRKGMPLLIVESDGVAAGRGRFDQS